MEPTTGNELSVIPGRLVDGPEASRFEAELQRWEAICGDAGPSGRDGEAAVIEVTGGGGRFRYSGLADTLPALELESRDPVVLAAAFLSAVRRKLPVVLVNPAWGEGERAQFERLMAGATPRSGAILIPTGGTTGGVKLAEHEWASLQAAALGLQDFLGGGPIDSCCLLPLHHVSGLMQVVRAVVTGGRVWFDAAGTAGRCLSLVPTQLQRALGDAEAVAALRQTRVIFVGGAPMGPDLAEAARQAQLPLMPVYGMTETAAMVAAVPTENFLKNSRSGALPIGEASIDLMAGGQIRVRTPALFRGYWGADLINRAAGHPTGDIGFFDSDGGLHVKRRMDALILSGGEKVDPAEVAAALCALGGVERALVVGEAHPEWGQQVVARIVAAAGCPSADQLLESLRPRLASYKLPKRIDFLPEISGHDMADYEDK